MIIWQHCELYNRIPQIKTVNLEYDDGADDDNNNNLNFILNFTILSTSSSIKSIV